MSFRDSKTGFLGPTSYNAVFTENPGSLSAILDPVDDREVPHPPPVSSEKIQQGAEVLSMFRDMAIYRRFTQRWFNLCDGAVVMQPVFRIWMDDLWTEFGPILQESRPEQLRNLSELVWRNTRRPLKTHGQMTALEWAKSATGRHLRWEVVGAILSQVGLIACNLSNWDTLFDTIRELDFEGSIRDENRVEFAERMRKAAEYCLCFCYESEVLNEIYVCFMYEDLILVECLKGDARKQISMRLEMSISANVRIRLCRLAANGRSLRCHHRPRTASRQPCGRRNTILDVTDAQEDLHFCLWS